MMTVLGFDHRWVKMMMLCVKNVRYSVIVNGEQVGPIVPTRGIRQGDPLSPYLYILCAEGLSVLLIKAESERLIKGISIRRNGPAVSHLLFADDSFLFFRATDEECQEVKGILRSYEKASGQAINLAKSGVFFSSNVFEVRSNLLKEILGIVNPLDHSKYLGLPSLVGSSKRAMFAFIRNKMWKRINSWSNKFLSAAGREVLLKSVVQAIPSYAMSVFMLPNHISEELQKLMNAFWWGSKGEGNRKIHWLQWDRMTAKKTQGGLGFRSLKSFNMAMLAKQAWRLVTYPESLIGRILKARYFPNSNFAQAKLGSCPSYTWRSIFQASKVLWKGLRWRVGSGVSIRVWNDSWIPRASGYEPLLLNEQIGSSLVVRDLMNEDGNQWDMDKIQAVLPDDVVPQVIAIPIFPDKADRQIWQHDSKGQYTVRSGYHVIQNMESSSSQVHDDIWCFVWRLNIPPKVKIFLWKSIRNILPSKERLIQRGVDIDEVCGCGEEAESVDHAIIRCQTSLAVWLRWGRLHVDENMGFVDLLKIACSMQDKALRDEVAMIAWAIWWARNQRQWNNVSMSSQVIHSKALDCLRAWKSAHSVSLGLEQVRREIEPNGAWQSEWIAVVDGAVFQQPAGRGVGLVVRSANGVFRKAFSSYQFGTFSAKMAEVLALHEALSFVAANVTGQGVIISDSQLVVAAIGSDSVDWTEFGDYVASCREVLLSLPNVKVKWKNRVCVEVAHVLAKVASCFEPEKSWSDIPACIQSFFAV